jgi:large subunit ribosomal protein L13e
LKEAGLSGDFAQSVGIAVDHRRHNKNADYQAENVKRLNEYKTKLVLFPRVEGKAKKGMINDSTAEQLKKATQNTTSGVLSIKPLENTVLLAPVTKEMKAAKVYMKLRQARIDRRYNGKRIKAAKEAEDKKK